jgi:hypothetical protein
MVSSRCDDSIRKDGGGLVKLTELRLAAKKHIEGSLILGYDSFECWVHGDEAALSGGADFGITA